MFVWFRCRFALPSTFRQLTNYRKEVVGESESEENMPSTAQAVQQIIWLSPISRSVIAGMDRSEQNIPGGKSLNVYAEEIEDRLRKLDPVHEKHHDVDYRSCFSKNGLDQLKIQLRLKQVTGGLKG